MIISCGVAGNALCSAGFLWKRFLSTDFYFPLSVCAGRGIVFFMNHVSLQPQTELYSIVYCGTDETAFRELNRLAQLVGRETVRVPPNGRDEGILQFTSQNCGENEVNASFHRLFAPYFAKGRVKLNYLRETAEILELMAAVGSAVRGKILGVVGARGGLGTSLTSLWLARILKTYAQRTAVIDLDPVSAGLDALVSEVGCAGKRWADLSGSGALLAGRLNESLPLWKGVRMLSADERGAVCTDDDSGSLAISALSQVNDWTVLDLQRQAFAPGSPGAAWVEWCDLIAVLCGTDIMSLLKTKMLLEKIPAGKSVSVLLMNGKSGGRKADAREKLSLAEVFPVRYTRTMDGDIAHGLAPGDRKKSATAQDLKRFCASFLGVA